MEHTKCFSPPICFICEMKFAKGTYEMKSRHAEELERNREIFAWRRLE